MNPFLQKVSDALQKAKITVDLVAEECEGRLPGDAVLTFRVESLLLRFTRQDAREFLEIACTLSPKQFYWFGDIEVAMGWASLEKVLSSHDPPPIQDVVNRLAQHMADLQKIFFKSLDLFAQTSIQRTMRNALPQIKPSVRAR